MVVFVADDMVACTNAGTRSISFVVKGSPAVQGRNIIAWKGRFQPILFDPSSSNKIRFRDTVRQQMQAIGLPAENFFSDPTAIRMKVKFVLPRRRKDVILRPSPPHLAANALSFPRGKDVDNLLKFVMDALEQTLYANDTNIVRVGVEKCYATDLMERDGWTEMHFWKVVCID
jgi:Holliday junction resolvase RusA-like endonuclease